MTRLQLTALGVLIAALAAALVLAALLGAPTASRAWRAPETPLPRPMSLPLCPTEDSTGCMWLADVQGNSLGRSFIAHEDGSLDYFPAPTIGTALWCASDSYCTES